MPSWNTVARMPSRSRSACSSCKAVLARDAMTRIFSLRLALTFSSSQLTRESNCHQLDSSPSNSWKISSG
ncbi:Uncharacterised protein [Vibrio cholerae]|nr:Uncharacterised protein [Vibrio cholerae]